MILFCCDSELGPPEDLSAIEVILYYYYYYYVQMYSQSVQPFDHISQAFELLTTKPPPPQMPPWGIVGRIVFSLCPFPDESTDVYRIWCQSVHPFGSFPRLTFVTP